MKIHLLIAIGAISLVVSITQGLEADETVVWKDCLRQEAQWYSGREAIRIAGNVLLYQRESGGWPKNIDMAAVLDDAERAKVKSQKGSVDSTIDNGATCNQLRYLGKVYNATGDKRCRHAFVTGIDFLLAAQYDNGGWPQIYPANRGYQGHITFNDGAMINAMTLLSDVRDKKAGLEFVDGQRRLRAKRAVGRGIECILKCQIVVEGKRLAWCAQHDEKTFEARGARSYEKASVSGYESVGIVKYLMSIERPSAKVILAIESAVMWFDEAKIVGMRVERRELSGRKGEYDKVVIADGNAPPIWARFYKIGTNRPIFCSRDGVIREDIADISYERRNGYSWYTTSPGGLLSKAYPAWRKRYTPDRDVLAGGE